MLSSIVKPTSHPFLEGVCEIKNQSQRRQLHFRNFVQKFKKYNFMSKIFLTHLEHSHPKFKLKHCSKKLQNLDGFTGPYFQSKSDNGEKLRNNLTRLIFFPLGLRFFHAKSKLTSQNLSWEKFCTVRENSLLKRFQKHSVSGSV